jgi:hypothetical protein
VAIQKNFRPPIMLIIGKFTMFVIARSVSYVAIQYFVIADLSAITLNKTTYP